MFLSEEGQPINEDDKRLFPQSVTCMKYTKYLYHSSLQQKISCKVRDEYDCLQKVLLPSEAANRVRNIPTTKPTPGT